MKYLVISTLPRNHEENKNLVRNLADSGIVATILYEEDYYIEGCKGCTFCWLKTPGRCVIRDDFEQIFKEILYADVVLFVTEAKLGFVSYKLKNMFDRIIPIVTPYLEIRDEECRHVPRYDKQQYFGLVYAGKENSAFLSSWLERVVKNLNGFSLGAHHYEERQVLIDAVNNI